MGTAHFADLTAHAEPIGLHLVRLTVPAFNARLLEIADALGALVEKLDDVPGLASASNRGGAARRSSASARP